MTRLVRVHRPTRQPSPIASGVAVGTAVAVRVGIGLGVAVGVGEIAALVVAARPAVDGVPPPQAVSPLRIATLMTRVTRRLRRDGISPTSLLDRPWHFKGNGRRVSSRWVEVSRRLMS
jgi:hypothetical protein